MTSVTLVESAKLALDELVAGVIENIITVNRAYEKIPFDGIEGNALAYNRENSLGAVATVGVGDTDGLLGSFVSGGVNQTERQAAKDPATFQHVTSSLTTIVGDAEVNGLIQATRSGDGNDQTAIQIASKAKAAGRKWQDMFINGDGSNASFPGLLSLAPSSQTVGTANGNVDLSFEMIDELTDLVVDKDGDVDYLMAHARTIRIFKALLRALGGAHITEVMELPSGATVPVYLGIPMFRNDWIPIDMGSSTYTALFAGTFDDGSRQHGIAGLTASEAAGIHIVDVGESERQDVRIWRVKWYSGLALFSEKGLAVQLGINSTVSP
ncbi:MAG: hypothetical protein WAN65_01770 [Candidatus Sulfotelmatobacter sp.]